ncbi:MAG TPA: hypothetical protein PLI17_07445 [Denitromonas sp.]|nr:hypothetical protein [Denitromonas sp.]
MDVKEGLPGFMAALYLYETTASSPQALDPTTFFAEPNGQNIPHRPAYPAGSAGYITLASTPCSSATSNQPMLMN